MPFAPSSHKFAMAVGVAGAMVEVTADVMLDSPVTRQWGRQQTFSDTAPGQFAFTLDNRDGKYTPDNAASSLATKVTEGVRVSWELNGQLRSGVIRSVVPFFPQDVPEAARVRVTVHDILGVAGRTSFDRSMADSVVRASQPLLYWPMSDAAFSNIANSGIGGMPLDIYMSMPLLGIPNPTVTFGGFPNAATGENQAKLDLLSFAAAGNTTRVGLKASTLNVDYTGTPYGYWGLWVTRLTTQGAIRIKVDAGSGPSGFEFGVGADGVPFLVGGLPALSGFEVGVPHYLGVSVVRTGSPGAWTVTRRLVIDGVPDPQASYATATAAAPTSIQYVVEVALENAVNDAATSALVSRLSHTAVSVDEAATYRATPARRLAAIAATVPGLVLDTLPIDLSVAVLGIQNDGSTLDAFNAVLRGEQGHIWSETTGTLLAPVEKVKIRGRNRPTNVSSTFATSADISGSPDLARDTTNMVSSVTANGSGSSYTHTDATLLPKVGSANNSIAAPYTQQIDLEGLAQDRLLRGINVGVDVVSISIDAPGTSTNRWADLLALTPGLRYRISGLPSAQLGVTSWDGWFLGAAESHTNDPRNVFTLYFERTLAATAIFDTDRFMAGGVLSLSANINAAVTSMSVATSVPGTTFTTTELPVDVLVGTERMAVTAATSATPQALTVTRGVGGTTAAAHVTGDLVNMAVLSRFAY